MTYHVGPNGKPSICKAKQGNCPYESISPHFDTVEKAQLYSDNLNAFIAKNITTETELSKHCKIDEIIESQHMEIRLKNIKHKEENILKQAEEQYIKLKKVMDRTEKKCPSKESFIGKFQQNDPFYKALKQKQKKLYKEFNKIIEYRAEAAKFYLQNEKHISDKSFSRASASSYFIFEKSSLKDTIDYLDKNGYEYKIRPDIQEAPGDNFLVRISDHNPRAYIITKDKTETVWDYTDASILVSFPKIQKMNITTNQLNKKLKILQTKNI
jgi:hypothetical protein